MKKFEAFAIAAATMLGGLALVPLPSASATNSIVGTWKLQSWVREIIATGKHENVLGEKPDGYITYSTDGRMMTIAVAGDRIKPQTINAEMSVSAATQLAASMTPLLFGPHQRRLTAPG